MCTLRAQELSQSLPGYKVTEIVVQPFALQLMSTHFKTHLK